MTIRETLRANPLFAAFDDRELEDLIQLSNPQRYPDGQWVTHYGSSWPYLFLVEEGSLEAVKESPEGRSLVILELERGMVFWGLGFFREGMGMPVALVAREETRLRLWSREELLPWIRQNGEFAWELTQLMVERMLRASEIVEELAFQPVAARLAHFLLEQFGDRAGDVVSRDLTLDEMAARIGSTREMVCRQLYKLADHGVIQINRTELKISDLNALRERAEALKGGDR